MLHPASNLEYIKLFREFILKRGLYERFMQLRDINCCEDLFNQLVKVNNPIHFLSYSINMTKLDYIDIPYWTVMADMWQDLVNMYRNEKLVNMCRNEKNKGRI